MHQTARVINKTHRLLFSQTGTVTPRNKRHPQRMRGRPYRSLEYSIEPLIHFAGQPRQSAIFPPERKQDVFQLPGHRNSK
jgi:hypothetical protein